ncbi:MAG TPA: tripartite tricarboxylate transporter substrate binding protein [Casimicrobiaceae bacterium]|nr:tripartite tricarboxylate transporter substrate binding protein [Casimicrobiaceae bacterium]
MKRRDFVAVLAGMIATTLTSAGHAQNYPNHPIRLVVPFAPGGGTDILARLLAPKVGEALGQQIVIDNRPGASSIIGTELVARAAPDGYTLLEVDTSFAVNPSLQPKLPYDSLKDLAPVIHLAAAPVLLVVHPSVPAKTLKELVALAKAKPGSLSYASGGNGASTHLAGELFKMVAGVDIVHVPYKGTGPAIADVVAGQVQMNFAGISSGRAFVESGRLRALAVTGDKRNPAMPDVPTFTEAGFPGVDAGTNWGLFAPAGTPAPIIARLNAEFNRALRLPDVQSRITDLGYDAVGGTPEQWAAAERAEIEKWAKVVKAAHIKID